MSVEQGKDWEDVLAQRAAENAALHGNADVLSGGIDARALAELKREKVRIARAFHQHNPSNFIKRLPVGRGFKSLKSRLADKAIGKPAVSLSFFDDFDAIMEAEREFFAHKRSGEVGP